MQYDHSSTEKFGRATPLQRSLHVGLLGLLEKEYTDHGNGVRARDVNGSTECISECCQQRVAISGANYTYGAMAYPNFVSMCGAGRNVQDLSPGPEQELLQA